MPAFRFQRYWRRNHSVYSRSFALACYSSKLCWLNYQNQNCAASTTRSSSSSTHWLPIDVVALAKNCCALLSTCLSCCSADDSSPYPYCYCYYCYDFAMTLDDAATSWIGSCIARCDMWPGQESSSCGRSRNRSPGPYSDALANFSKVRSQVHNRSWLHRSAMARWCPICSWICPWANADDRCHSK